MNGSLSEDGYEEPRCLLNMHSEVTPIPVGRIIDKLDSYLNQNDYIAAERHLKYWLNEADDCHDMRGKLTMLNEQIGLYRKTDIMLSFAKSALLYSDITGTSLQSRN